MSTIVVVAQIAVALGIFNVWIVRRNRPTSYRPRGAANIEEEFRRYGLPDWVRSAVGALKLTLAVLLLLGLFITPLTAPAAGLMALLMISAIIAHLRVSDPLMKAAPAAAMLALSVLVAVAGVA